MQPGRDFKMARFKLLMLMLCLALGVPVHAEPSQSAKTGDDGKANPPPRFGLNADTGVAVWFEVNLPRFVNKYLAHADQWKKVGTLIVSTVPQDGDWILQRIISRQPNVIPGLKTNEILSGHLTDPQAWARVAKLCRRYAELTGSPVVILEHETAFKPYTEREAEIDYDAVERAIRSADWRCEIWWYPAVIGESVKVQHRTQGLARAGMAAIAKCHLISTSHAAGPRSHDYIWSRRARPKIERLDENAIHMAYLAIEPHHWPLDQTDAAVEAAGDRVILYPGFDNIGKAGAVRAALSDDSKSGEDAAQAPRTNPRP